MKNRGFYRGVNLGGWLSQCDYSNERLNTFITEKDIDVIAGWGLDHVRIPIDYNVLENEDGAYRESGFMLLEKAVDWCTKRGLRVVIDLHKTAGFSFDVGEKEEGFFSSEKYQTRFYHLWQQIAARFGGQSKDVAFELLNEVTDPGFIDAWNRISQECVRRIRRTAPDTLLLIGSYHNNSAEALKDLAAPMDQNVVYNFHCYDPLEFTHQGAPWVPQLPRDKRLTFEEAGLPSDYFEKRFQPALEAANQYGAMLYCGEYGVIDRAKPEEALKWFKAIHDTFEKFGIARSAWSYKQMDFGLSDPRMDCVRDELIKLL